MGRQSIAGHHSHTHSGKYAENMQYLAQKPELRMETQGCGLWGSNATYCATMPESLVMFDCKVIFCFLLNKDANSHKTWGVWIVLLKLCTYTGVVPSVFSPQLTPHIQKPVLRTSYPSCSPTVSTQIKMSPRPSKIHSCSQYILRGFFFHNTWLMRSD